MENRCYQSNNLDFGTNSFRYVRSCDLRWIEGERVVVLGEDFSLRHGRLEVRGQLEEAMFERTDEELVFDRL